MEIKHRIRDVSPQEILAFCQRHDKKLFSLGGFFKNIRINTVLTKDYEKFAGFINTQEFAFRLLGFRPRHPLTDTRVRGDSLLEIRRIING